MGAALVRATPNGTPQSHWNTIIAFIATLIVIPAAFLLIIAAWQHLTLLRLKHQRKRQDQKPRVSPTAKG